MTSGTRWALLSPTSSITPSRSGPPSSTWKPTMFGESPFVAIIDDGDGMSKAELLAAMVLGSQDPRTPRDQGDLGRFGLGTQDRVLFAVPPHDSGDACQAASRVPRDGI